MAGIERRDYRFCSYRSFPGSTGDERNRSGDFMKAWGGISSIQFALPVLWTSRKETWTAALNDIAKWLCEKPAALPGSKNQKEKLQNRI